jgi:REP element-mobilizing transposase RayT
VNPVGATLAVAQNTHHRRSIRLVGYDYSKEGMYFVTICCHGRICRFGHINGEDMILNEYGQIAFDEWINLKGRYPYVSFDVFQLMPNHLHGIIDIPRPTSLSSDTAPTATLGNIVGAYKSLVMRKCLDIYKAKNMFMGNFWQRNYYEHIIRDQESYDSILEYILNNPAKWKNDSLYMDSNKGL